MKLIFPGHQVTVISVCAVAEISVNQMNLMNELIFLRKIIHWKESGHILLIISVVFKP